MKPVLAPMPRTWEPTQGRCSVHREPTVRVDRAAMPLAQGYVLRLLPEAIYIEAHDEAGLFYARQTLQQLRRVADADGTVPAAVITDWPDLAVRGLMLDISRDRVPTMRSLEQLIDTLAGLKVNQLQLYTEHTFAYAGHEEVWRDASPMTADEVKHLNAYCKARFIELVPNQNCFGHLERWLKHERYKPLAECPDGFIRDDLPQPFFSPEAKTLNPLDPRSVELVDELLSQLLPCFSSDTVNVGCDETFDLGKGRSKTQCERLGKGRVYLNFLKQVHALCEKHGKRMQYWGDIVLHYPDMLKDVRDELPGAEALNWGYEATHPFERETRCFADAGLGFMVCPSTATFVGIGGRVEVMRANIRLAVEQGLRHGAAGMLNTWWGDFGHWQPWATNGPGIVYGASAAWCLSSNADLPLERALSLHVWGDDSGRLAEGVCELGRLTRDLHTNRDNVLGWSLIRHECELRSDTLMLPWAGVGPVSREQLESAEARIDRALALIALSTPTCADAALLVEELAVGGAMLRHASANLKARLSENVPHSRSLSHGTRSTLDEDAADIIKAFEKHWLSRSRPGGLRDSTHAWRTLRGYYQYS